MPPLLFQLEKSADKCFGSRVKMTHVKQCYTHWEPKCAAKRDMTVFTSCMNHAYIHNGTNAVTYMYFVTCPVYLVIV